MSNYIGDKCKDNLDNIILAGDFNCHRDYPDNKNDPGDLILEDIIEKFSLMDAWTTRSGKRSEEGNTYFKEINGGPGTRIAYVFFTKKLKFPLFDIFIRKPLDRTDSDEESSDSTDSDEESSDSSGSPAGKYKRFSNHNGLYFELNTSIVDNKTEANNP